MGKPICYSDKHCDKKMVTNHGLFSLLWSLLYIACRCWQLTDVALHALQPWILYTVTVLVGTQVLIGVLCILKSARHTAVTLLRRNKIYTAIFVFIML